MTSQIFRAVILVLLVASTVLGEGDPTNINSCTTPETVLEGEAAALTCIYSQNVERDKQDFYIFISQNGKEPVIVTICAWDEFSSMLNCDSKHGYNVMVRAHQVILNISSAQPFHTGNYSCSTLPPANGQRIEQCSLSVQAKTTTDTMSIVCNKDVSQPSVMCMFSESIDATTILLERHDLLKNTRPVEVMRCDIKSERCTSPLNGYQITTSEKPGNIKVYGVIIPLDAADKNGLYVCKTPEGSSCDMCTLKTDEVSPQPDTDNTIVQTLTVPLYLICVCVVVIVIIVGVIVFKRYHYRIPQYSAVPISDETCLPSARYATFQESKMKILYYFVVLSALCLTATGRPGSGDNPITCETSGTVLEDTAAEVTCDFHSTFDNADDTFYVYRQASNEPVIITICSWNNGDPQCRFVDDFTLKTVGADGKVTFEVPSALQKHSGNYICKTLPADEANAVGCTLSVQKNEVFRDNPVSCHTSSPVLLGDQASLFCMFPKTIGMTGVTLEKYCGPEGACKEEIVRCEKDKTCSVHKEGYQVDHKTESYLRVSISRTTADSAGIYLCRSTDIIQESGICSLELKHASSTKTWTLTEITPPLYAILACFMLLILLGAVAFFQRYSSCSRDYFEHTRKGSGDSAKPLMNANQRMPT